MTGNMLTVTISRKFDASAEHVFDAWLDPDTARNWFFATGPGEMVRYDMEPHVGGSFVFTERRDGQDVEHVGEYLEIERPHRLVFIFAVPAFDPEPSTVTVEISRLDKGCGLPLTHLFKAEYAEFEDRTRQGWTTMLTALAAQLEI